MLRVRPGVLAPITARVGPKVADVLHNPFEIPEDSVEWAMMNRPVGRLV